MANALIKIGAVGPNPQYQDGDVISIYNDATILFKNAEIQCGCNRFGNPAPGVLRPTGTLEELWYEGTHQWKFQRVSRTELAKINLWDGEARTIYQIPDLQRYLARRLRNNTHNIFGPLGGETWYQTPIDFSAVAISALWDSIEPILGLPRTDFVDMPFGRGDRRHHLLVSCEDITNDDISGLLKPDMDADETILRKRKVSVAWEDARFGLTDKQRRDAKNKRLETDERQLVMVRRVDMAFKAGARLEAA